MTDNQELTSKELDAQKGSNMGFEFEKELAAFAQVMRDKLNENQHKSTWKNEDYRWLFRRLEMEVEELRKEIAHPHESTPREIAREAADVACFAMMIADVFGGLPETHSQQEQLAATQQKLDVAVEALEKIAEEYNMHPAENEYLNEYREGKSDMALLAQQALLKLEKVIPQGNRL